MMRKIITLMFALGIFVFLHANNISEPSQIYPQSSRDTLLLSENFDDTIFPPPGWQSVILVGFSNWERSGTPTQGGAMYGGHSASYGSMARLISRPINMGVTIYSCTLKFYMYHDPGYPTAPDSVKVEYSTNGTTFTQVAAFNRYAPSTGWVEYSVYLGMFSGTIYVGFLGFSGYGNNIYIDEVRLYGWQITGSYIDVSIDTIISPGATHRVYTPLIPIVRLRKVGNIGPVTFPIICSIVGNNSAVRYTNTQTVIWTDFLDTMRVSFTSWTPTIIELCTVKVRIIYPDSNSANNRKTRTTLIAEWFVWEGFNDGVFPPPGWQANIISGTYNWIRATSGTNPTCAPYEGEAMAGYQSFSASSGSCARLISPPIDFGSTPVTPLLQFYMYHDPGYPGPTYGPDSMKVQYSTDGINFIQVAAFRRYEPIAGWNAHTVALGPISGIVYIGFLALSEYGHNMYIDMVQFPLQIHHDVGVDSIISPLALHRVNTPMIPIARVRNFSHHEEFNFPVVCSIIGANGTLRYTNTQYVSSLGMGATIQVNFSPWTPTVIEQCTVKMRTNLSIDDNPTNDGKTRTTLITTALLIEGFNNPPFPPQGWQAVIVNGSYNWQGVTVGTNPTCTPYEGAGMACYPSGYAAAGSQARLITPLIIPTNPWRCTLKFYMYHDPSYPGPTELGLDSVKVEYSLDGTNFTRVAAFSQYEATASWTEHAVYLGNFSVPFYVGILGFSGSGYGANIYIDYVRLSAFSGIAEDKIHNVPLITLLNSPKPNPITNSRTHLSFTLAEPSQVTLKIYDASGRIVKTLVDDFMGSGVHCVNWNCRDNYNRKVAEGVYFCTLETPKQKFIKKIIYIG